MNFCYAFLNVFSTFFFPGEKDTTHSMFFDALPGEIGFWGDIVWSQHVDAVKYIITVLLGTLNNTIGHRDKMNKYGMIK